MNHTCLYSPAAKCHRPLAGTHCAYLGRDSQAELTCVAYYLEINVRHRELNQDIVTHPSTNCAWRRLTSLISDTLNREDSIGNQALQWTLWGHSNKEHPFKRYEEKCGWQASTAAVNISVQILSGIYLRPSDIGCQYSRSIYTRRFIPLKCMRRPLQHSHIHVYTTLTFDLWPWQHRTEGPSEYCFWWQMYNKQNTGNNMR